MKSKYNVLQHLINLKTISVNHLLSCYLKKARIKPLLNDLGWIYIIIILALRFPLGELEN